MAINRPRGTADIIPLAITKWHYVEKIFQQVAKAYNFKEIRTPIFEHTELFVRGVGDTTDIVEKEMYTFLDRGDRSITLRPEGTASVVRAYLENHLDKNPQPTKLYYNGAMFRYDRPQAGRFRQFHQLGVEAFGSDDPSLDAEVIAMAMDFYERLGLKNLVLHLNSVGCPKCRAILKEKLLEFFKPNLEKLCVNCKARYERNPLRILDCKSEHCSAVAKDAPSTLDCLCEDCSKHFEAVKHNLDLLKISYEVDSRLVRGLDYYTKTAFEIVALEIGAQSSIGGGGRYNGLVEECGGSFTPGIGYALGMERIILTMEQQGIFFPEGTDLDVFVAVADEGVEDKAVQILSAFRKESIRADKDYLKRSLKAQMKYAGKLSPRITIILGSSELERGKVVLKDMVLGEQEEILWEQLLDKVKEKLTR